LTVPDCTLGGAGCCPFCYSGDYAVEPYFLTMRYNNERDVLIRRNESEWDRPNSAATAPVDEMWRVVSRVAVRNPLQRWAVALEHARAHAKRTGGDVYRQVGNATPERVERDRPGTIW
jgi:hypothetical protein